MIILDQTIVNVALPTIQTNLHFSQSNLAWVINAYLIAFGGLLLLAGRLGDLVGRKRMFLSGLALFTAASLVCGLAQSQEMLVVARFVQGVGGAMASAIILGMIVTMFPESEEQTKAIGVYTFVAASGGAIGLLLGGVITEEISWHWIFFVNVPIGFVTGLVAQRLLTDDKGIGVRHGTDAPGAFLLVSSLMIGVYAIVGASPFGWGSAHTLVFGALAAGLLMAFVWRQTRAHTPLVPLRIFRSRAVSAANAIQMLMTAGMFGMFFLGALYLQRVFGYDAVQVGLVFLPVTLGVAVTSLCVSPRLIARFGTKLTLLPGLLCVAAALLLFRLVPEHASYFTDLLPPMLLLGIGAGLGFPTLLTIAMSASTPDDSGLTSGLVNTTQQVGGALGLAVLASVSASRTSSALAAGHSQDGSLVSGYRLAFTVGAALLLSAVGLAAVTLRTPRSPGFTEAAEPLVLTDVANAEEAA
jgi:EmrB/QacA subfamily drug resistance transporter